VVDPAAPAWLEECTMGTCFECDENFELGEDAEIGTIVSCPKCATRYEVLNTFPVTLDYAVDEDEET